MDANTWQSLIDIITLLAPFIAAIPGLLALRSINRKTRADAKKSEADAASVIESSSIGLVKQHEEDTQRYREDTQRYKALYEKYETMACELKAEFTGCKEQLTEISIEMGNAMKDNIELQRSNTRLVDKVNTLEETIKSLVKQLRERGIEPLYGKRADDSDSKGE